jgi:hypothetical protein
VGLLLASCSLLYNKASLHPPILFLLSSLPLCLTSFLECESGLPAHRFPAAHQHPTQHNTTVHAWPPYPLSRLISTSTTVRQPLLKFNPQEPPFCPRGAGAFCFSWLYIASAGRSGVFHDAPHISLMFRAKTRKPSCPFPPRDPQVCLLACGTVEMFDQKQP